MGVKNDIIKTHKDCLKNNYIKSITEGFVIANKMLYEYLEKGHTIEETKKFCMNNMKNSNILEKVIKK